MKRRRLLWGIAAILTAMIAVSWPHTTTAAAARVTKVAMLDNIAQSVLAPGYADVATRSEQLAAALRALTAMPQPAALAGAQQAWAATLLAWRRTQVFVHGPVADLGGEARIQFWPARRQSVDRVLRASRPIDDRYIDELGANAVGLSALEQLLFDPRQDEGARAAGFAEARQREYALALAADLARRTRQIARMWDADGGYRARFVAGGQDQLNLLVNDMLAAVEGGAQGRLQVARDRRGDPQLRTEILEGGISHTSHLGVQSLMTGLRDVYTGGSGAGIDDYLGQLKPGIARRIDVQLRRTIDAVNALAAPLDEVAKSRPQLIARAYDECRALELLLKVEGASALGVTLTFTSTDGD